MIGGRVILGVGSLTHGRLRSLRGDFGHRQVEVLFIEWIFLTGAQVPQLRLDFTTWELRNSVVSNHWRCFAKNVPRGGAKLLLVVEEHESLDVAE